MLTALALVATIAEGVDGVAVVTTWIAFEELLWLGEVLK